MIQMLFGIPEGYKQKVLAILTDSSTNLRSKLSVLGFSWNPVWNVWARHDFQPHVVDSLRGITDAALQPSEGVLQEYRLQTSYRPQRVFEDACKYEMLLDYQTEALSFINKARSGIVALDIGLGKTLVGLAYAEGLGLRNLIVCPASLRGQWYSEISKFTDSPLSRRVIINGTRVKREDQWNKAMECQYAICSYDLLKQVDKSGKQTDLERAKEYLNGGLLICDEIMRVKTSSSKRTKAIKSLRENASLAIGLTGTPIDNNLGEFYTILNIVSPGFIPNYERFAEMFLVRELRQKQVYNAKKGCFVSKDFWMILGEKNVDEFRQIIKPLVFRKEKRECLNLPPASTVIRQVELSKEQKRIEKRLLELSKEDPDNILKYFTYARENFISPSLLPIAAIDQGGLSLWAQVLGNDAGTDGFLEYVPSEVQKLLEGKLRPDQIELTPRLREVADILEESGREKIIVFCTFVKALELIKRCILKEPCSMIVGGCNVEEEMEKFRGDNRVLLMSEAGMEGINMQHCHLMVSLNVSWTASKMAQLHGRIERSGQKHPMTFYELRSSSQVENRILKILERKEKLSEKVLARRVMEKQAEDPLPLGAG